MAPRADACHWAQDGKLVPGLVNGSSQLLGVEKEHQQLFQLCADDACGIESNIFCSAVQLCACSWKQGGL